jgi:hypothetical protein
MPIGKCRNFDYYGCQERTRFSLKAKKELFGEDYIGCLVGYTTTSSIVSNSWYNSETSGQTFGIGNDKNS